jgi:outer membrane protein OmpA-like peptidoglycan-associated protein
VTAATDIEGVTRVRNQLSVAPPPIPEIESNLDVQAGVATLTGAMVSDEVRINLVAEASRLFGAGNVVDDLGFEFVDRAEWVVPDEDQVELQADIDEIAAELVINFPSGSSVLAAEEQVKLAPLPQLLSDVSGVVVAVEGHTDGRGDNEANQILSQARAEAVSEFLLGEGVGEDVLRAVGNGESQLIADDSTPEGQAQNRRTVFRVVV